MKMKNSTDIQSSMTVRRTNCGDSSKVTCLLSLLLKDQCMYASIIIFG